MVRLVIQIWSFTSNSNAFRVRITSMRRRTADRIIPIMLKRKNSIPRNFKFTWNNFINSSTGIIKLLERMLNEIDMIEFLRILLRLNRIFSSKRFLSLSTTCPFFNSFTIILDLSMVLARRLLRERRSKPTPEISTIGEIHDWRNFMRDSVASIWITEAQYVYVVDYVDFLFSVLRIIFEIVDVNTPSWRAISANELP